MAKSKKRRKPTKSRKPAKRRATKRTNRPRTATIGKKMPAKRKGSKKGGALMEVLSVAGGMIAGQAVGKIMQDKVPQLADGKLRGAALIALGVLGAKSAPASMRGVAVGLAASGAYQLAKEVAPGVIGSIGADADRLSPADVDLIESMALESEIQGLEDDVDETVSGNMDESVIQTVTGDDDDDDDDDTY